MKGFGDRFSDLNNQATVYLYLLITADLQLHVRGPSRTASLARLFTVIVNHEGIFQNISGRRPES